MHQTGSTEAHKSQPPRTPTLSERTRCVARIAPYSNISIRHPPTHPDAVMSTGINLLDVFLKSTQEQSMSAAISLLDQSLPFGRVSPPPRSMGSIGSISRRSIRASHPSALAR